MGADALAALDAASGTTLLAELKAGVSPRARRARLAALARAEAVTRWTRRR